MTTAMLNTWSDPRIVDHPHIDDHDPIVRGAAEHLHRNESLHRHNPQGEVCVYCALNASRVLIFADRQRARLEERR